MIARTIVTLAAVLATAPGVAGTGGEPPPMACGPQAAVGHELAARYAERPVAQGVTATGWLMQLYAGAEGGTWSLVLTRPDGIACLVDYGEGIERLADGSGEGA